MVRYDPIVLLRAAFIVPVDGPPMANGTVEVEGSTIVAVGRASAGASARAEAVDLGDVVLLPGLVNAHTHLELTHLHGRVPPSTDFAGWLGALYDVHVADPPAPVAIIDAVERGVSQSLAAGVTAIGDITRQPQMVRPVLARAPQHVLSFGEVIAVGTLRNLLDERLRAAADRSHDTARLRAGVSPHAPYTVEPDGLRAGARAAAANGQRLCIHLAESPAEEEFTLHRRGPLVDFLRRIGVWDDKVPCCGARPVACADVTEVLTPTTVIAHANYVNDEEIALLARRGVHVAYCPRTHAAFGHPPHRFRKMLDAGITVCLGTDSLACAPSLSILDEMRFLRRARADLPGGQIIRMGTLAGAKALGMEHAIGSLAPGKQADLCAIPMDSAGPADPIENVLSSTERPVAVYIAGQLQHPPDGS